MRAVEIECLGYLMIKNGMSRQLIEYSKFINVGYIRGGKIISVYDSHHTLITPPLDSASVLANRRPACLTVRQARADKTTLYINSHFYCKPWKSTCTTKLDFIGQLDLASALPQPAFPIQRSVLNGFANMVAGNTCSIFQIGYSSCHF